MALALRWRAHIIKKIQNAKWVEKLEKKLKNSWKEVGKKLEKSLKNIGIQLGKKLVGSLRFHWCMQCDFAKKTRSRGDGKKDQKKKI